MQPKFTLYHYWRSSCSWRVRWALKIKGLDYESKYINLLKKEQQLPDFQKINPALYIPALVIEEGGQQRVAGESLAILEWLEERWPSPALLPKTPLERLWVRQLCLTIASGTQPLQNPAVLEWFVPDASQRAVSLHHWISRGLSVYESYLQEAGWKGPFSLGADLTLADLCLIPQVYSAYRFGVPLESMPRVAAIYETCMMLPDCFGAAPEQQADAPVGV